MPRINNIQVRRDTAANWTTANPTLSAGEIGFETNTGKFKIGTGSAAWTALAYANGGEPSANTNTSSSVGYVGLPQIALASGGLTISKAAAGEHIYVTGTGQTITIPANSSVPFEIGTTVVIINAAAVTTSIAITTDTLIFAGTSLTGTRTLGPNGMATAIKITATSWIISGNGLT
jgi:hypothetical protein